MIAIVKLLGIFIVFIGAVYMLKPEFMKKVMNFWLEKNRIYLGAIINILIGILFINVAPYCSVPWVITVIGLLGLVKGVVLAVRGPEYVKKLADKWLKKPASILRAIAVLALVFGALLILAA